MWATPCVWATTFLLVGKARCVLHFHLVYAHCHTMLRSKELRALEIPATAVATLDQPSDN